MESPHVCVQEWRQRRGQRSVSGSDVGATRQQQRRERQRLLGQSARRGGRGGAVGARRQRQRRRHDGGGLHYPRRCRLVQLLEERKREVKEWEQVEEDKRRAAYEASLDRRCTEGARPG